MYCFHLVTLCAHFSLIGAKCPLRCIWNKNSGLWLTSKYSKGGSKRKAINTPPLQTHTHTESRGWSTFTLPARVSRVSQLSHSAPVASPYKMLPLPSLSVWQNTEHAVDIHHRASTENTWCLFKKNPKNSHCHTRLPHSSTAQRVVNVVTSAIGRCDSRSAWILPEDVTGPNCPGFPPAVQSRSLN